MVEWEHVNIHLPLEAEPSRPKIKFLWQSCQCRRRTDRSLPSKECRAHCWLEHVNSSIQPFAGLPQFNAAPRFYCMGHIGTRRWTPAADRKLPMMGDPLLNYFGLGVLFFVVMVLFYGIIAVHDIPHPIAIAKSRNHPHQDAIHPAGWVNLFTLHALWPCLWIWAMVYRPDSGWGVTTVPEVDARPSSDLRERIAHLEGKAKSPTSSSPEITDLESRFNGNATIKTGGDQWISC